MKTSLNNSFKITLLNMLVSGECKTFPLANNNKEVIDLYTYCNYKRYFNIAPCIRAIKNV